MQIRLLKSKLHRATTTRTRLDYHGSITIDEDLMDAVGLRVYEAVTIANCSTGSRAETYVLKGERGSGAMELNGAMARLAEPGDRLIIFAFGFFTPEEAETHKPIVAVLDHENKIVERWEG